MIRLYTIDSKERPRVWDCEAVLGPNGIHGIQYRDGLLEGGKLKDWTFKEAKEKNVGRENYLSPENQAKAMVIMEAGKKQRKNYFHTVEEARTNKLFMPMLAHKFTQYGDKVIYPTYSQPKLDGARCNVYWCKLKEKVVARTRTGKDYSAVLDHIVAELTPIIMENKGVIFDGEIYNHKLKHDFEMIMSLCRQGKPTEQDLDNAVKYLEYHIYDVCNLNDLEATFDTRSVLLQDLFEDFATPDSMCIEVPVHEATDSDHLDEMEAGYLEDGYEGQMVRDRNSVYKVDGRSKDLLKKKIFIDEEFDIVEIEEGEGAWKGAAKRIIIRLPDGRTQGCGVDGSYELNKKRLENKDQLIGKCSATVRYFRLTKDGKLYIPVCKDINRHD